MNQNITKEDLINLVNTLSKDMGINVYIPILIEKTNNYGSLKVKIDNEFNIYPLHLKFNEKILLFSQKRIKKIIIHELIHYKIFTRQKNQIYNIVNIVFPHGLRFILYAIKYKTWCLRYLIFLGLYQMQIKLLFSIRITKG